jgi:hypothetical protein
MYPTAASVHPTVGVCFTLVVSHQVPLSATSRPHHGTDAFVGGQQRLDLRAPPRRLPLANPEQVAARGTPSWRATSGTTAKAVMTVAMPAATVVGSMDHGSRTTAVVAVTATRAEEAGGQAREKKKAILSGSASRLPSES